MRRARFVAAFVVAWSATAYAEPGPPTVSFCGEELSLDATGAYCIRDVPDQAPARLDFRSLWALKALRVLDLSDLHLTDLTGIGPPWVRHVTLTNVPVTDLSPLAGLKALDQLILNATGAIDFAALDPHQLVGLGLARTPFSNLQSQTRLGDLSLDRTQTRNFGFLKGMPRLVRLAITNEPEFRDLALLCRATKLKWISLSGTSVADLSPVTKLAALTDLDLSETPVTDLSPLRKLAYLEALRLAKTRLKDLEGLVGVPRLKVLHLEGATVDDFSALARLPNLTHLYLSDTNIKDLSPLAQLTKLQIVDLGTRDPNAPRLEHLEALEHLPLRRLELVRPGPNGVFPCDWLRRMREVTRLAFAPTDTCPFDPTPDVEEEDVPNDDSR